MFGLLDAVIESARGRILGRPEGESASQAVLAWVADDLIEVERPYSEALRSIPKIVASDADLRLEERLRFAQLEDVLATAFAQDIGESPDGLRARVMATIAVRGMLDVWNAWYQQHSLDADFDPADALALKADYLRRALEAGRSAIESLTGPPL